VVLVSRPKSEEEKAIRTFSLSKGIEEELEKKHKETDKGYSEIVEEALRLYFYGAAEDISIEELQAKLKQAQEDTDFLKKRMEQQSELAQKLSLAVQRKQEGKQLTQELFNTVLDEDLKETIEILLRKLNDPTAFSRCLQNRMIILKKDGWTGNQEDLLKLVLEKRKEVG
jgi:hypothetical protein